MDIKSRNVKTTCYEMTNNLHGYMCETKRDNHRKVSVYVYAVYMCILIYVFLKSN
jgi:hypothetical protein